MNNTLKKYINIILNENIKNINRIEKLNVFDFDMTIYNPHEKTWNESVVNNICSSINNNSCRTILCTARSEDNQIIKEVFLQDGLHLNALGYKLLKKLALEALEKSPV